MANMKRLAEDAHLFDDEGEPEERASKKEERRLSNNIRMR